MVEKNQEISKSEFPEIKEIEVLIKKIESRIEKEKIPEEREKIIKKEIKNYLEKIQETPNFAPPISTRDEAKEISQLEPDQQVGTLISLALEEGLEKAISVAKQLNNPAILDEFHDILVDRYYQILIEKKFLKP